MEQKKSDVKSDEIITCPICSEYQGTPRQVNMHRMQCVKKLNAKKNVPEEPTEVKPRRKRVPFGTRKQKLSVPGGLDPKFEYRWFNDNWRHDPTRLMNAEEGWWKKVDGVKEVNVGTNEDGSPIKGVLMRIPKEFYQEDQQEKQKEVDMVDDAIQKGTFKESANDNRYIPDGIKIHSNFNEPK